MAAETTQVYVEQFGPYLSWLPGQRLSRCTCRDDPDHPGPKHPDGSWVGRGGGEIDIIEAAASNTKGETGSVSMSLQLSPFDAGYNLSTADPDWATFYNTSRTTLNKYRGSAYQQAASGLTKTNFEAYELSGNVFNSYGFEYIPGGGKDSHVTWTLQGEPQWRLGSAAMGPNPATEIGQRLVPEEPMYILLNLGISSGFTYINWQDIKFPAKFKIDYVRVYQDPNNIRVGCDPADHPTADYIARHIEAYTNPNLTMWSETRDRGGYEQRVPGNSMLGHCKA